MCAGVSALFGALALGLTEVMEAPVELEAGEGSFRLRVPCPEVQPAGVQVLLETVVRALEDLESNYRGSLELRWLDPWA